MHKRALVNQSLYAVESLDRDRVLLAVRVKDIVEKDPEFTVDEFLEMRVAPDDIWSYSLKERDENDVLREVEGVPGYVGFGETLLLVLKENIINVGRAHEHVLTALQDLATDYDQFNAEYQKYIDMLRKDYPELRFAADSEKNDAAKEQKRQESRQDSQDSAGLSRSKDRGTPSEDGHKNSVEG